MRKQLLTPKRLKIIIIVVVLLLAIWAGFIAHRASTFHVIKTNPSTRSVATITPFLDVYFSRELSQAGLSVTSSPQIIVSHSISGKVLKLNLSGPLQANVNYIITVNAISDTTGKTLKNINFSITPSAVDYSQLPADQQKAILQRQTASANKDALAFTGTDALLSNGLSTPQVAAYQQDIQAFAQANKITPHTINVYSSSVTPGPLNGSGTFSLAFTVAINNKNYKAEIQYSGLTTIELTLFDSTSGVQLFNTGSPS
jgi:hypothetical protein